MRPLTYERIEEETAAWRDAMQAARLRIAQCSMGIRLIESVHVTRMTEVAPNEYAVPAGTIDALREALSHTGE